MEYEMSKITVRFYILEWWKELKNTAEIDGVSLCGIFCDKSVSALLGQGRDLLSSLA